MTVFLLRRSRRSPSSSQAYLWSDAWLLQAVAVASQTQACDLADVLQAADGIQHTAMSPAELHGGLVRLTAGGLLIETDGRFALTSSVPQDVRNQLTAGFAIGRPVAQSFLRSEPWDRSRNAHDSRNDGLQYPGLTPERFRKAEKEFPRAT